MFSKTPTTPKAASTPKAAAKTKPITLTKHQAEGLALFNILKTDNLQELEKHGFLTLRSHAVFLLKSAVQHNSAKCIEVLLEQFSYAQNPDLNTMLLHALEEIADSLIKNTCPEALLKICENAEKHGAFQVSLATWLVKHAKKEEYVILANEDKSQFHRVLKCNDAIQMVKSAYKVLTDPSETDIKAAYNEVTKETDELQKMIAISKLCNTDKPMGKAFFEKNRDLYDKLQAEFKRLSEQVSTANLETTRIRHPSLHW